MIALQPCPKSYSYDQDKAIAPAETVAKVKKILSSLDLHIIAATQRIDTGRLDIPVFLSICGDDAKAIMPTRKQMGKGATPEQAEASALMELMERFGFFSFWEQATTLPTYTWNEAESTFGDALIPLEAIIKGCHDTLSVEDARRIMNVRSWIFVPAIELTSQKTVYLPLDFFKQLGEFNGSSAGNTDVESILQGTCELIERHVCALISQAMPVLPTIDVSTIQDPLVKKLVQRFTDNGIEIVMKDFSYKMPLPTVAVIAKDPTTFPTLSEIVYTAGTATTPEKAAIRALTEVAQLAGDFCTAACYEASGLPKFASWEETEWLRNGPLASLSTLPQITYPDILQELETTAAKLAQQGYTLYSVATTHPLTKIPSHYNIIPGFHFRERDANSSLGLFVGRMLAELDDIDTALNGLSLIGSIYPNSHFLPFFSGMLAMRASDYQGARSHFMTALPLQPDNDSRALTAFYAGYTYTLENLWKEALPLLDSAVSLCPEMKEFLNLRGVCHFKCQNYAAAKKDFAYILQHLDKGSVIDLLNMGLCCKHLDEKEDARHYLTAALKIDPTLTAAQTHLAELTE